MVSTRIFLSIPFSLATCSRMNPRFVSIVDVAACVAMTGCPLSVFLVFAELRAPPFGVRGKLEDQVRPLDVFEADGRGLAVDLHLDAAVLGRRDVTAQDALSVGGGTREMNFGELPLGALEIAQRTEWPIEARRAHFEVVVVRDDVGDIENGCQI